MSNIPIIEFKELPKVFTNDSKTNNTIGRIVAKNQFLQCDCELTADENRILHIAITRNKDEWDKKEYLPIARDIEIDASYFAEELGIAPERAYTRLRDAAETLFDRWLFDPKGDAGKGSKFRWITSIGGTRMPPAQYNKGRISFRLSEELCSYLECFSIRPGEKTYSSIPYEDIKNLSPRATALMKYLFTQFNTKVKERLKPHHLIMDLMEFRRITNTHSVFAKYGDLNRRVIKPALKNINENSCYSIEVETIKEGKTVVSLNFKYYLKSQIELELS